VIGSLNLAGLRSTCPIDSDQTPGAADEAEECGDESLDHRTSFKSAGRKKTGCMMQPQPFRNSQPMSKSKSKNGNKETKKPKKVHVPNPPGLPASLAALAAAAPRPKRK
jgi:hypothetical protein